MFLARINLTILIFITFIVIQKLDFCSCCCFNIKKKPLSCTDSNFISSEASCNICEKLNMVYDGFKTCEICYFNIVTNNRKLLCDICKLYIFPENKSYIKCKECLKLMDQKCYGYPCDICRKKQLQIHYSGKICTKCKKFDYEKDEISVLYFNEINGDDIIHITCFCEQILDNAEEFRKLNYKNNFVEGTIDTDNSKKELVLKMFINLKSITICFETIEFLERYTITHKKKLPIIDCFNKSLPQIQELLIFTKEYFELLEEVRDFFTQNRAFDCITYFIISRVDITKICRTEIGISWYDLIYTIKEQQPENLKLLYRNKGHNIFNYKNLTTKELHNILKLNTIYIENLDNFKIKDIISLNTISKVINFENIVFNLMEYISDVNLYKIFPNFNGMKSCTIYVDSDNTDRIMVYIKFMEKISKTFTFVIYLYNINESINSIDNFSDSTLEIINIAQKNKYIEIMYLNDGNSLIIIDNIKNTIETVDLL